MEIILEPFIRRTLPKFFSETDLRLKKNGKM